MYAVSILSIEIHNNEKALQSQDRLITVVDVSTLYLKLAVVLILITVVCIGFVSCLNEVHSAKRQFCTDVRASMKPPGHRARS